MKEGERKKLREREGERKCDRVSVFRVCVSICVFFVCRFPWMNFLSFSCVCIRECVLCVNRCPWMKKLSSNLFLTRRLPRQLWEWHSHLILKTLSRLPRSLVCINMSLCVCVCTRAHVCLCVCVCVCVMFVFLLLYLRETTNVLHTYENIIIHTS